MEKNYSDVYRENIYYDQRLRLMVDIGKMGYKEEDFHSLEEKIRQAYKENEDLEGGALANPDEERMVGHYWLRNPQLAPGQEIRTAIEQTLVKIKDFVYQIHRGEICGQQGLFQNVLVIGIGGSSLGSRFLSQALRTDRDRMRLFFINNTDPDGIDQVMAPLQHELGQTLVLVISKSGGTTETRNGMEEVRHLYGGQELDFARHAVAVTLDHSSLAQLSQQEGWLEVFPMWDWIGGRTSVLSAVGLLPLALQGIDVDLLLQGARECDLVTRRQDTRHNPAALLAMTWYLFTQGHGGKSIIILPYKDRLELFSQYFQQLVMESLGKAFDRADELVNQGIAVWGNKGATDQHSYLQQLLEGPNDFFVTFIEVLMDRKTASPLIGKYTSSGDYLHAFLYGTRDALNKQGRKSLVITLDNLDEYTLGVLVALCERTVGFYASLINVNAYHQPAVELGKESAARLIDMQQQIIIFLTQAQGKKYTVEELAEAIGAEEEIMFSLLRHLGANSRGGVKTDVQEDLFRNQYWI